MYNIAHSDLMRIGNVVLEGIKYGVQKKHIKVRCKIQGTPDSRKIE